MDQALVHEALIALAKGRAPAYLSPKRQQRMRAVAWRRRVATLRRYLVEAEAALAAAEALDAEERHRRREAKALHACMMDQRKRRRIIDRAERRVKKKAPWHERAALRIHTPLIG